MERKPLSDILSAQETAAIRDAWDTTEAAEDFAPLPPGDYACRLLFHECVTSRSGTPGVRLTFQVSKGEHAGRKVFAEVWLTARAMAFAKRDLGKLGIQSLDDLEKPTPAGILCNCRVALRETDDGTQFNTVRRFDVTGVEPADPFAPTEEPPAVNGEPEADAEAADADEPGTPF